MLFQIQLKDDTARENKTKTNDDDLNDKNSVDFNVSPHIGPPNNTLHCVNSNQLEEEQEAMSDINNSQYEKLSTNQNLLNLTDSNVQVVIERLDLGQYSHDKCKAKTVPSCKVVMRELQQSCSRKCLEVCF